MKQKRLQNCDWVIGSELHELLCNEMRRQTLEERQNVHATLNIMTFISCPKMKAFQMAFKHEHFGNQQSSSPGLNLIVNFARQAAQKCLSAEKKTSNRLSFVISFRQTKLAKLVLQTKKIFKTIIGIEIPTF